MLFSSMNLTFSLIPSSVGSACPPYFISTMPLHDVVLVVVAHHPEARRVSDGHVRDVAHAHGRAGVQAVAPAAPAQMTTLLMSVSGVSK